MRVFIYAMTADPLHAWICCGIDRVEAEYWFEQALGRGADRPLYRVVCTRKDRT